MSPSIRVFISYAREDTPLVLSLADGLQRAGFDVWWDKNLEAGDTFREVIQEKLQNAQVILVVWSKRANTSRWVLDEAEVGAQQGILLPLRIDTAPLPLGFRGLNALDFKSWGNDFYSGAWLQLLSEIRRIAGSPNPPGKRPAISTFSRGVLLTTIFGCALGLSVWALYSRDASLEIKSSYFGHPIIDAFVLAFACGAPIAFWSAYEVKRAGFDSLWLTFRRFGFLLVKGAIPAVVILVAATAAGAIRATAPVEIAAEVIRFFLFATTLFASILAVANFLALAARRTFGLKAR
jgi:hypothetical protein